MEKGFLSWSSSPVSQLFPALLSSGPIPQMLILDLLDPPSSWGVPASRGLHRGLRVFLLGDCHTCHSSLLGHFVASTMSVWVCEAVSVPRILARSFSTTGPDVVQMLLKTSSYSPLLR